jgi:uncharacterized protein YjbI with pentapeptide repeats
VASFQDEVGFNRASFQGVAVFSGASFQRGSWFERTSFHDSAKFYETSFHDSAGFYRANFHDVAVFEQATFRDSAGFGGASFQGSAEFRKASFQGPAGFYRVSFQGPAGFKGVRFQGGAGFREASFERATQVGPLLGRQLDLDGAVFNVHVQIDVTAAAVCARRARFPAGVHLRLRYATVDLDDAYLAAPAILAGASTPFPDLADQEKQLVRSWARLSGPPEQSWQPRLLSVQRADVAGLHLAEVDLRACRFAGAHNLDRLRVEGAPQFARTTGWWRARRKTLAEEQHWHATRPGRWRPGGWYPPSVPVPGIPQAEAPAGLNRRDWRRCTGSCARAARTPRTSLARPTSTTASARCAATIPPPLGPSGWSCGCTGWCPGTPCRQVGPFSLGPSSSLPGQ